jgi:hypothetical protein
MARRTLEEVLRRNCFDVVRGLLRPGGLIRISSRGTGGNGAAPGGQRMALVTVGTHECHSMSRLVGQCVWCWTSADQTSTERARPDCTDSVKQPGAAGAREARARSPAWQSEQNAGIGNARARAMPALILEVASERGETAMHRTLV